MDEITVVKVENQKVVGMRRKGKYELIAQLLPKVYEFATSHGAKFTGPPIFIYYERIVEDVMKADMEENADIEIVFPIQQEIEETKEIKCYDLPGGIMAKIIHKGPYEACAPTYEKLYNWIEKNGKTITGPIREVYLNDPREVGIENALTEIYAPIN